MACSGLEQANQVFRNARDAFLVGEEVKLDLAFFDSPDHSVRHAMADILCCRHFDLIPNFMESLLKVLNDEEPIIRSRGVHAIQVHFLKFPEEAKVLIKHYLHDEDGGVKATATEALGEHFSEIEDSNALLLGQLKDQDERVRISAIAVIDRNFTVIKDVESLILTLSKDPADEVRLAVLTLIHSHRDSFDDLSDLITLFANDPVEEVRLAAGGVLWSAGHGILDPDWVVRKFIGSEFPEIRGSVVNLVASRIDRIDGPEEVVVKGLHDSDPAVRLEALYVLAKRTKKLLRYCKGRLIELCEDDDGVVRGFAQWLRNEILRLIKEGKMEIEN